MRVYQVSIDDGRVSFVGKRVEVLKLLKLEPSVFRAAVQVAEVDVPTDKANLLMLLNGTPAVYTPINEWRGTARGGLRVVQKGAP